MTGTMTGQFSQLLLGVCAGALLAMAAAMLRAPRPAARWSGFAFFFCSAMFALKLWNDITHAMPQELRFVIGVVAITSVGWFWLMVMALFGDLDRYRPVMFLAPVAMGLCGLGNFMHWDVFAPYFWAFTTLLQGALAVMSIVIVMRSWKDDLVESRRRLRGPFMVAVGLYILSLNGFDIVEMLGTTPVWYPMLNAALLAGDHVVGGAFVFLDPREAMFRRRARPAPRSPRAGRHASPGRLGPQRPETARTAPAARPRR